jgi:hypothetical protein
VSQQSAATARNASAAAAMAALAPPFAIPRGSKRDDREPEESRRPRGAGG